jgi:hypothetical protein
LDLGYWEPLSPTSVRRERTATVRVNSQRLLPSFDYRHLPRLLAAYRYGRDGTFGPLADLALFRGKDIPMNKATKTEENYRHGNEKEHCSICTMWRPPHSCTAVAGGIEPDDLCKLFKRKKAA